jgi:hypothetical protein
MVLRSRLLSVGLALVAAALFAAMTELTDPASVPAKPATDSSVLKVAAEVKAKFTSTDFFDPATTAEADRLRLGLQSSQSELAQSLQKQLAIFLEMQRRLEAIRGQLPAVMTEFENLLGQSGALNRRLIRPDSPFVGLSAALERIRGELQSPQGRHSADQLKALGGSIKSLLEARAKLDDPALADQMNDRRKQIVARVDSLTLMKRAKEWESALQSSAAVVTEILRLSEAMVAEPKSVLPSAESLGMNQMMLGRLMGVLGALFFLASLWEVRRSDRRVLETVDLASVDSVLNNANRFQALQRAQEALPYLQLSAKQINDLTKQLMAAIKGLGLSASGLDSLSEQSAAASESQIVLETQGRTREISRAVAMAKEQGIRLSLAIAQSGAETRLSDLGDRMADSMEQIDSLLRELQQNLDHAVADRMSSGPSAADAAGALIKRDSEGLLLVASQWSRQFERLNDALSDLERLLLLAATTSPQEEASTEPQSTEPKFKLDGKSS